MSSTIQNDSIGHQGGAPHPSEAGQQASTVPIFRNILVVVDSGDATQWALKAAVRLAESGARISLLHVVVTPSNWGMPEMPPPEEPCDVSAGNDFVLDRCAAEMPGALMGERIYREGDVHHQIVRVAREHRADLLVIGTHGRHALGRLLLGSTAVYVLRHLPCPVLVAGRGLSDDATGMPGRVLVGVDDDGGPSLAAAEMAQRIAGRRHARMALVHAIPQSTEFMPEYGIPVEDRLGPHVRETGEVFLASFLIPAPGTSGVERSVREGDAARELLSAAADWNADLIVIGTHGRHGLGRLILGSTAERVACKAPCPVLCVGAAASNVD
ncbi:MAG TPA: universal stress protein [Tepidisphaeraceae bacterium]|jgi:nucleotide-binding universal stress UspA family protein